MLKEISCEKFMVNGKVRDPIRFHPGLNTIIGDSNGSNSIGKSTLMMIIDFCFGGEDYFRKEKNIIDEIGHHEIKFQFEFNNKTLYFIRSTSNPNYVYKCDINYSKIQKISIELFKNNLLELYKIDKSGLRLRQYISPYFRIYNRGTHNEYRPLNATVREADNSGISCLLMMYGLYNDIKDLNEKYQIALDRKKEYDNLKKFNIAPIAESDEEVGIINCELTELKRQLNELNKENSLAVCEADLIQNRKRKLLTNQRKKLKKEIDRLNNQKNDIKIEEDYNKKIYARQFNELLKFFPNIELAKIEEVEKFHKKVEKILKKEAINNDIYIDSIITILENQINDIDQKLLEFNNVPNISEEILLMQSHLLKEIDIKEQSLKNYELREKAKSEYNKLKTELDLILSKNTKIVEDKINNELNTLNLLLKETDKEKKYAPVLNINNLTSYAFYTPHDTGTGSRYKAVCLLDLTLLRQTDLPLFVHDSIMYTNIEKDTCNDLLRLYEKETNKQIIIGIDDPTKYRQQIDGKIVNLAEKYSVIELSIGDKSLFGKRFNVITEEESL